MELIKQFGEMWARTATNIGDVRLSGRGVYILYDGSTPVYLGKATKGDIGSRVRRANRSGTRKNFWDHFSWYVIKDESLIHDVEVLLLKTLPPYLRHLTNQGGKFKNVSPSGQSPAQQRAEYITRKKV